MSSAAAAADGGPAVPFSVVVALLAVAVTVYWYITSRAAAWSRGGRGGGGGGGGIWHRMDHAPKFLQKKKRQQLVLSRREFVTHDTLRLRFDLPDPGMRLGLPVGKCVKTFMPNIAAERDAEEWNPRPANAARDLPAVPCDAGSGDGDLDKQGAWREEISRKYTPCTLDSHLGYCEFCIKVYRAGTSKIFPHGGKGSQYLETLEVGDTLDVQGPFGLLEYKGRGTWRGKGAKGAVITELGLLAGGSGVTPMLQVIQAVLSDPEDATRVSLLYANKTPGDIIVKDMLDEWAASSAGQFRVHYTVDDASGVADWGGSTGFITAEMIEANLPGPSAETLVLMCGPPPMLKFACKPNLEKLGYDMRKGVGSF